LNIKLSTLDGYFFSLEMSQFLLKKTKVNKWEGQDIEKRSHFKQDQVKITIIEAGLRRHQPAIAKVIELANDTIQKTGRQF